MDMNLLAQGFSQRCWNDLLDANGCLFWSGCWRRDAARFQLLLNGFNDERS